MNWINKIKKLGESIKTNIKKNFLQSLRGNQVLGQVAVKGQS
tara:strand:+ start:1922 stop:2047 length:126 start_codon:yes stop_codon:yes gene_type:complete